MSRYELKLPRMGESVAEATITTWLKEVGDIIELDDSIVEIATDKVDSEVPSEVEGVLLERLFIENDVVKVGEILAIIEIGGDDILVESESIAIPPEVDKIPVIDIEKSVEETIQQGSVQIEKTGESGKFY